MQPQFAELVLKPAVLDASCPVVLASCAVTPLDEEGVFNLRMERACPQNCGGDVGGTAKKGRGFFFVFLSGLRPAGGKGEFR